MALKKTKFWRAPETLGHGRSIQMVLASAPAVSCVKNRQRTETTSPLCLFCTLISPDTPVEEENGGEKTCFRVRESPSTAGWLSFHSPICKVGTILLTSHCHEDEMSSHTYPSVCISPYICTSVLTEMGILWNIYLSCVQFIQVFTTTFLFLKFSLNHSIHNVESQLDSR